MQIYLSTRRIYLWSGLEPSIIGNRFSCWRCITDTGGWRQGSGFHIRCSFSLRQEILKMDMTLLRSGQKWHRTSCHSGYAKH